MYAYILYVYIDISPDICRCAEPLISVLGSAFWSHPHPRWACSPSCNRVAQSPAYPFFPTQALIRVCASLSLGASLSWRYPVPRNGMIR